MGPLVVNQIKRQADLRFPGHPIWAPIFVTAGVITVALLLWEICTAVTLLKVRKLLMETAKMAGIVRSPRRPWRGHSHHCVSTMGVIQLSGGTGTTVGGFAVGAVKGGALGLVGIITTAAGLMMRQRGQLLKTVRTAARTLHERLGDVGEHVVQWLCVYTGLRWYGSVSSSVFGYSTFVTAMAQILTRPP